MTSVESDASAKFGVIKPTANSGCQSISIASLATQNCVAVNTSYFRERSTISCNKADAGAHRFNRRKAETLIERGNDSKFGLSVEFHDAFISDIRDELDMWSKTKFVNEIHAFSRFGFANDGQGDITFGTQFRYCLKKV